jgi:2,5-diketo-D-gluconate reductase A
MTVPAHTLNDGQTIPALGFGTYPLRGDAGRDAILSALEVGYRLLDTAVNYRNEREVGEALRASGLPREEVFVTSKLPGRHHGYDAAVRSTEVSLESLGLDYLDLHLIHWPNPSVGQYHEAWRALVHLQEQGLVRSIGVSNFTEAHLQKVIEDTGITPAVNQVELHPYFPQVEQRAVHDRLGIRTQSWSPLGKHMAPFSEVAVTGPIPIPKAASPQRQRENLDVFGFELTDGEVAAITALGRSDGRLFGGDPDTHEEQ